MNTTGNEYNDMNCYCYYSTVAYSKTLTQVLCFFHCFSQPLLYSFHLGEFVLMTYSEMTVNTTVTSMVVQQQLLYGTAECLNGKSASCKKDYCGVCVII